MWVSAHSDQNHCSEEPLSVRNTSCHRSGAGNDLSLAEKVGVPCNYRSASAPLVWRRAGPTTCAGKRGCVVLGDCVLLPTPEDEDARVLLW